MKLHALEIPDEPQQIARWLEERLVGIDLGELVAELSAVAEEDDHSLTLEETLGRDQHAVLREGMSALSLGQVKRLLSHPHLLLELQEQVLSEGGAYWQRLSDQTDALKPIVAPGRERLSRELQQDTSPASAHANWHRNPVAASLATAAVILITLLATSLYWKKADVDEGWGWSRSDALPRNVERSRYLSKLADGGAEWFDARPTNASELAQRLGELRMGCSRLLLAEHQPLNDEDRMWLREKCRAWADKLDRHLAELEDGRASIEVRKAADETVRSLVAALRERAKMA